MYLRSPSVMFSTNLSNSMTDFNGYAGMLKATIPLYYKEETRANYEQKYSKDWPHFYEYNQVKITNKCRVHSTLLFHSRILNDCHVEFIHNQIIL